MNSSRTVTSEMFLAGHAYGVLGFFSVCGDDSAIDKTFRFCSGAVSSSERYKEMKLYFQNLSIGCIGIAEEDGSITNLYFETDAVPQDVEMCETEVIKEAFRQLEAYLAGDLRSFSVPVAPRGTAFMRAVNPRL